MLIRRIGLGHIEKIAHQLAIATMSWDEPIPAFKTRYPKVLESCIAAPFQTYAGRDLYPSLPGKAAILFYLLVKNHPFQNLPAPRPGKYYFYVLECDNGNLYKGSTNNLVRRLEEHQTSQSGWTSKHRPVSLRYFEEFDSQEEALKREQVLKTGFGRKWLAKKLDALASRQAGGNKRLAVTTLLVFLLINSHWLTVAPQKLYNLAVWVAESDAELRDAVIMGLRDFIKKYAKKV